MLYREEHGFSERRACAAVGLSRSVARYASRPDRDEEVIAVLQELAERFPERGFSKLALVGMSCQSSVPPIMASRKVGKPARRFTLNIGLLCSKTFDDAIFEELFWTKYGLAREDIAKVNIKGVFQIWMRDGSYHEVPLKECHAWTREGCVHCPDFAAEHADISTGGIGKYNDWTLTIVRTDIGREIIVKMLEDGTIQGRPGDDDPGAIELLR